MDWTQDLILHSLNETRVKLYLIPNRLTCSSTEPLIVDACLLAHNHAALRVSIAFMPVQLLTHDHAAMHASIDLFSMLVQLLTHDWR